MISKIITLTTLLVLGAFSLTACSEGGSGSPSSPSVSSDIGEFEVRISNGTGFSHKTKGAKIHLAKTDLIGLKANKWGFRINGLGLADEGSSNSQKLGKNNTSVSMYVEINGKNVRVGCKPAKKPKGTFNRTALSKTKISGNFSVEMVQCRDYMTGKIVSYTGVPFQVEGDFKDLPLK